MRKQNLFDVENSEILKTLIFSVLSIYNTVYVVGDNGENFDVIKRFFDSNGLKDVNYVFNDAGNMCTLNHCILMNGSACNIQRVITVRESDLSFYPCFKAVNHHILKFGEIDKDTLELIPFNVELATLLYLYNPTYSNPKCDRCVYGQLCHKGCYIENYEVNKDFFQPIEGNCTEYQREINKIVDENQYLKRYLIQRGDRIECQIL